MIKAVIFDLDGTLIHLPINYEKLIQEFSRITGKRKLRPLSLKIQELDRRTKERIFRIWDKTELKASTNMTVKDEGIAIYRKFLKKPKAVVTMQGKPLVQNVLPHLGLSFDCVITRENCLERSEQLTIAAKRLKTAFHNILFIGDTDNDLQAAMKVGCHFLRVADEDMV